MRKLRNAPDPMVVEFVPAARRPPRTAWLLLAAGLVAAVLVAGHLLSQMNSLAAQRQQVAELRAKLGGDGARRPAGADDPEQARAVAARLGADWGGLLAALAQGLDPEIRILELQGDAARGTIRVVAEAPNLEAAFAYVERLQGQPPLRNFGLESHAWSQGANVGVLTFWAAGEWGAAP